MNPLLYDVEYVETAPPAFNSGRLHITTYNIERGRRLESIIEHWCQHPVKRSDILLISEADRGMARSGNRHVARDFAAALGYSWAYAVEFIELTKGDRRERRIAGRNEIGQIGNAILSRYPLSNLQVIRLPCFFDHSAQFMARIGSRIALVADVRIGRHPLTVVSVHLESQSSPAERAQQLETIIEIVQTRDHGQPIVIAGDMNTTGLNVRQLIRSALCRPWTVLKNPSIEALEIIEPMFTLLRREGYNYRHCNLDGHTLQDRGYKAHLDWFFVKNVTSDLIRNPVIYKAFANRHRFSDHLPIAMELALGDRDPYS